MCLTLLSSYSAARFLTSLAPFIFKEPILKFSMRKRREETSKPQTTKERLKITVLSLIMFVLSSHFKQ